VADMARDLTRGLMATSTQQRPASGGAGSPDERPRKQGPRKLPLLAIAGIVLAVILLATGVLVRERPGTTGPSIGGPFALIDGDGRVVKDSDFHGRYMLVYFGYTFCPDVCPTTLNEVALAMDKLGPDAARVAPIFITVDPKRDTPAVMKQYVSAFSPALVGLTGSADAIAQVEKSYRVYASENRTGPGPGDYTVDHSSILYLMNPAGQFIAPIRADESADDMAADIKKLLS